jgi:hypothetical protein
MLEQIIKAENKGLLEEIKAECPCPVSLATIKNYVSILIPAYLFKIGLQRQSAIIAEVCTIYYESNFRLGKIKEKTSPTVKQLFQRLIDEFKTRFDYELNSHLYQVSNYMLLKNYLYYLNFI